MAENVDINVIVFHVDFHTNPPKCVRTEPPGFESLFVTVGGVYHISSELFNNETGKMIVRQIRRVKYATITD